MFEGFTNLDWIFFAVLIGSTILATIRGGIFETLSTASWLGAWIVARFTGPLVDSLIKKIIGLPESSLISMTVSYFIVFIIVLFLAKRIARYIQEVISQTYFVVIDHTFGVLFGIVRGIFIMGLVYWGTLWYCSDEPQQPKWLIEAKTRPVMQFSAITINDLFLIKENKLLEDDARGTQQQAEEIYDKLINPEVVNEEKKEPEAEVGYKSSERKDLENQLLKLDAIGKENISELKDE